MKSWASIALVAILAAILSSASWAADNGKAKGNAFGQAGDGNPHYNWTPAAASVANNSNRAAEESVDKRSNDVLFGGGNPNNVCQNPISAAPGRNPHCGGPTP
jgi:hypothetical protein